MPKRCIICGAEAEFQIKGTNNYYCKTCAEHMFSDTKLLVKMEREAEQLKRFIESKIP